MSNHVLSRISPYEDRRLGYPRLTIRQNSERFSTVWHRLPADSLTSPPIPVAVGPFMVELFTVGCLVRSPRLSGPVWSVARRTAPHVSTVERTRHDSKPMSPRDGIRHSFATPALFRTAQCQPQLITKHVRLARIQITNDKEQIPMSFIGMQFVASCRHCSSICLRSRTRQRGYWRCLVPSCPIGPTDTE